MSARQTNVSVQNGCVRSNRMDVSVQGQPISVKWIYLFSERMCLVGTVAPSPTEQMCLLEMVAFILIERIYLLQKDSSKFLYKGHNSTPK